jgi:hypothetical protein
MYIYYINEIFIVYSLKLCFIVYSNSYILRCKKLAIENPRLKKGPLHLVRIKEGSVLLWLQGPALIPEAFFSWLYLHLVSCSL